jgi:prepilin-type N-terminal cleavage/methylation domain-containing protein
MTAGSSALSGARGGTLIEVLLALVVLAVGVTAATQLLVEAFAADSRTLQRERAGMLLSDLSESV